jgi:hypothetical protein
LTVLSFQMFGCGEAGVPPAGTPGTGPATGPPTKGEAMKDREKFFKHIDDNVAKQKAAEKKP